MDVVAVELAAVARIRANSLDRQLAAGVESWRSPVHAARALQITSDRSRRRLAESLERLLEEADEPVDIRHLATIRPYRVGIREARPLLLTLAARLRDRAPVTAAGVAALKRLVTDGSGPVFSHGDPSALVDRLRTVVDQLPALD